MTELLPSKSDICSNAEDSSTDMLLVGFESYMVNEQGLSQETIRGRMFMIHRALLQIVGGDKLIIPFC